jgi:hypothetical protein
VIRLIAIAALAATLGGCVTSPLAQKPAAQTDTSLAAGHVGMPPSAPRNPNHCIHDEGYGRWTDCGSEM